ncbi:polymeric immunoglobulin receptor-like protein [Labeo rohita]|nr:polymeric immunoglobulin receptor-like protein [Labeo rohita]
MKILLIFFTFYLISGAVRCFGVTGYSGGSVLVDSGKRWFSDSAKYMAKLPEWRIIINNTKYDKWINEGRFTLFQNSEGNLMIYIKDVNQHDATEYQIKVEGKWSINMTLNVKEDRTFVTESAHLGEEVNITCQIPEKHKLHFCKEVDNHICHIMSTPKVTQMNGSSERNEERVFTVIISNVSVRDAGVYWCGAETRDTYLTFISLNTKIQLIVIMAPVVRHEGESAEIICPYDSIYKSKSKSLCKGKCSTRDRNTLNETVREEKETKTDRLTLNDDVTASVFTGTITGLTAEDAGKYWCAVTLERDLNYLYTHLIVIMNEELNLTKYEGDDVSIQCKHQDEDQKSFCKAHEASMCVKDGVSLETIRDDRFSFSDEASTGVFTVNITDLREEDSGIYWCGAHVTTKVHLNINKKRGAVKDIDVTGYSGGSVLVDSGDFWLRHTAKYMYKLPEWTRIIYDKKHDKWINERRFTLFQNNEGNLMIYIRELNQHDAGRYRIRVGNRWSIDMTLNVKEDSCCKVSKNVMVNIGETATFSCEYSQNHINDPKIIFKEEKDSVETIYKGWNRKERFSISDDKHKNIFIVRITAVTPDDGGVYLCGVRTTGKSYTVFNTVYLHIKFHKP